MEADEADGGGIAPPSAPAEASLDTTQVRSSAEHADNAVKDRDAGLAGDDAAGGSAEKHFAGTAPIATASTANMSTTERDEVAQFHQRRRAGDAASTAGGPKPDEASGRAVPGASSDAGRRNSGGDIGIGHAVLAAAQELALHCQVPGVSEAAAAVCIMANMATDSRDNVRASESRLRLCRTIVLALKRAAKVAEKVSSGHFICSTFHAYVACVGKKCDGYVCAQHLSVASSHEIFSRVRTRSGRWRVS